MACTIRKRRSSSGSLTPCQRLIRGRGGMIVRSARIRCPFPARASPPRTPPDRDRERSGRTAAHRRHPRRSAGRHHRASRNGTHRRRRRPEPVPQPIALHLGPPATEGKGGLFAHTLIRWFENGGASLGIAGLPGGTARVLGVDTKGRAGAKQDRGRPAPSGWRHALRKRLPRKQSWFDIGLCLACAH